MRAIVVLVLCACAAAVAPPAADLSATLRDTVWISFAPTHYFPSERPPILPSRESIEADLRVIRAAGFSGLVTYGADVEQVAEVAHAIGFKALLLGIWNPLDAVEVAKALKTARDRQAIVTGIIVGNEGLMDGRYAIEPLCNAMRKIQEASGKPVSTTETIDWLLSEPRIGECSTFITANAHPFFTNRKDPGAAVTWTVDAWEAVRSRYPSRPMLFKEVGLPTAAAAGMSEQAQADYYAALRTTGVVFSYFEAFDAVAPFKHGPVEQSWGLWKSDRTPKRVVAALLAVAPR